MSKNFFVRFVSEVLLVVFLYPAILPAIELEQNTLAASSIFEVIYRGLAAGEEAGATDKDKLLGLIVDDIAKVLETDHKRTLLRRGGELAVAKGRVEARRVKISVAIDEYLFEEVKCYLARRVIGGFAILEHDTGHDYFARPRSSPMSRDGSVALSVEDEKPISSADKFKGLLERMMMSAVADGKLNFDNMIKTLGVKKTEGGASYCYSEGGKTSVLIAVKGALGIGHPWGSADEIFVRMTNQLLVDPEILVDNLEEKMYEMRKKMKTKAQEFGFTDVEMREAAPEARGRIAEITLAKRHDVRKGRKVWKVDNPAKLTIFLHAQARLVALEELLGASIVDGFIESILIVEKARTEFAADFLNDPIIAGLGDDTAFKYAAMFSYLAMVKDDGKISEGGSLTLKQNWTAILAEYYWIAHVYGNPEINIVDEIGKDEQEFIEGVRKRISAIIPDNLVLVNRMLKKYFGIELASGQKPADLIAGPVASCVWSMHDCFVLGLGGKAEEFISPVTRGLAAGEELMSV